MPVIPGFGMMWHENGEFGDPVSKNKPLYKISVLTAESCCWCCLGQEPLWLSPPFFQQTTEVGPNPEATPSVWKALMRPLLPGWFSFRSNLRQTSGLSWAGDSFTRLLCSTLWSNLSPPDISPMLLSKPRRRRHFPLLWLQDPVWPWGLYGCTSGLML